MKNFLITVVLSTFCTASSAQVYQEYLLSSWTFQIGDKEVWLPAEVPGSLQNDLTLNGRKPTNVSDERLTYRTTFIADEFILAREHIELLFKGLDTKAAVYLNKQLILEANNMFRSWTVPIKSIIEKGENSLEIVFDNKFGDLNNLSIRKAAYHFQEGNDSSHIPVGIWKPIILQSWNTYKLDDAFIKQDSLNGKEALLTAIIDLKGNPNSKLELEIYNEVTDRIYERRELILEEENQQFQIPFSIRKPKYWYPLSLGEPDLYMIGIRIKKGSNEQSLIRRVGLREVNIISAGNENEALQVKVNGKPVNIKGVNYEPFSLLTSNIRSTEYNAFFDKLIKDQVNIIRVLGTGIYESDYFYDLADTKGILIIQDFMFNRISHPASPELLDNIQAEAKENINLIKQHPSLILWTAGNNLDGVSSSSNVVNVLSDMVDNYDSFHPFVSSLSTNDWKSTQGNK